MFPFLRFPPLRSRLGALLLTLLTLTGASAQTFVQKTGTDNPFNDLIAGMGTGVNVAPALADFDNDGDLDLVAGYFGNPIGRLVYFQNVGTPTVAAYTELTGTDSPFNGLTLPAGYLNPAAGDLNGDGKTDLVVGINDGTFLYLKNTGTASVPAFTVQTGTDNPFSGIDVGVLGYPALADLDGDGLLDFVGRDSNESVHQYYKNTGAASAPTFTLQTGVGDPFSGFGYGKPVLGDLNGDGTVDLLSVGDNSLLVIPNFGTTTAPSFATGSAFFIVQEFGSVLKGTLGDINGDGRLDIVLGYYTGGFYLFLQVPPPPTLTHNPTPANQTVCAGGSASTTVAATGEDLTYQWYRNQPDTDEPVDGQTSDTLNLTNVQPTDAGTYYARVSNAGGAVWSTAFTLTVSQPEATISGTVSVCPNAPASPVTFAASGGTAPYTFTYRLNNGTDQTITTTSGNSISLNQATTAPGTFTYELVSVADANKCTQTISEQSAVVTVEALDLSAAPTVSGTPVCAGQAVTVTFGVNCPGFAFTAELSDASGSFANSLSLGAIAPSGASVVIPSGTAAGTGYRIRVVSTNPALTSPPSAAFIVNALGALALTTPTTASQACPGEALTVSFGTTGSCPFPVANVFTVQLSNAIGSFVNPRALGTSAAPGTTNYDLPSNLPTGTGYRIRVVSSLPVQISASSAPFQVVGPSLSVTPTVSGVPVCRGSILTVNFSLPAGSCPFPEGNAFTAQLSSATGSFNNPTILGRVLEGQANSLTLPASVAAGTGYRVRVVSSSPSLTSSNSVLFQVKNCNSRLSAEEPSMVVSPNPVAGDEIRCRVSGMDNPAFGLTTLTGRSVDVVAKTDGTGEWVLTPHERLLPGVYALQASEGTIRLAQRVLVIE